MTKDDRPVSEEDLHAYADGVLDAARHAEVEAHLAARPEEAARVETWRRQNETLRALYGPAASEPVPARLHPRRLAAARPVPALPWRRLAAVLVLLALGAGAGWFGRGEFEAGAPAGSLVAEAVAAHRLYAGEVVHPVEVRAEDSAHLKAWLSKRLSRPLALPDLTGQGLAFVGGRLLPAGDGPAAQLMYEDEGGRRLTLYIVPAPEAEETALRLASADGLEAVFWRDETLRCALVGELPRDSLRRIATDAYKQLG
ncbi:transcriptional regulator [Aureimonas endophytica]|uniref:Transcriptional regulator n=1 Tax=Aureimonas endophytica TaxID=2027858 RepID=A0A916ZQC8_9HYPH|nr:anti-sigma factor [Aureimonas endophytica]GGE09029.1 transcriptional regulator [Aureimonas endophytica]